MQTWMYVAFPVLLYIGERAFRAIRSGFYEVDILKVFNQFLYLLNYSIIGLGIRNIIFTPVCFLSSHLKLKKNNKPLVVKTGWNTIIISQSFINHCQFNIKMQANLYPGKVLLLKMQKPEGFKYQSGMYIFLQCPQISPFEW